MAAIAESNAVAALQTENVRLTALLDAHGIEWRLLPTSASQRVPLPPAFKQDPEWPRSGLSTADKVASFRRLLRGRTDVYPLLEDDTCHFLAVDFDEAEWQQDALAFSRGTRVSLAAIAPPAPQHAASGRASLMSVLKQIESTYAIDRRKP